MKKYLTYAIAAFVATTVVAIASPEAEMLQTKEKAAWQSFKDRKVDDFKKIVSPNMMAVYAEGICDLQQEIDRMPKFELKSFAFSDYKVVMTNADTAVTTYQAKTAGTMDGKEMSATYNCGSVWQKKDGEWRAIFHSDMPVADAQKKE